MVHCSYLCFPWLLLGHEDFVSGVFGFHLLFDDEDEGGKGYGHSVEL